MGKLVRICKVNDVAEGTMKRYNIHGIEIVLAKIDGKYYAAGNKCPHYDGDLSQGKLEGTVVTCPRHGYQFNLTDGSVVYWLGSVGSTPIEGKTVRPAEKLTTYQTIIDGQDIMAEI